MSGPPSPAGTDVVAAGGGVGSAGTAEVAGATGFGFAGLAGGAAGGATIAPSSTGGSADVRSSLALGGAAECVVCVENIR